MVSEYQNLIKSIVYKVCGNAICKSDVDDIVASVNLKLLEKEGSKSLSAYNAASGMELTTFIGMVAKCEAVDTLRRRKPCVTIQEEKDEDDRGEIYTPISAETDALTALLRKEQAAKVRKAIKMLTEDEQHFLAVIMSDDGSVEQYAEQLGVTVGNLKVKKHRIIAKLKKILRNMYRDAS